MEAERRQQDSDGADEMALSSEQCDLVIERREKILIIDGGSRAKVLPRYRRWKCTNNTNDYDKNQCDSDTSLMASEHSSDYQLQLDRRLTLPRPHDFDDESRHGNRWTTMHGNPDRCLNDKQYDNLNNEDWAVPASPSMHARVRQHPSAAIQAVSISPNRMSQSPMAKTRKKSLTKARTGDISSSTLSLLHTASVSGRMDPSDKPASCLTVPNTSNNCIFIVDVAQFDVGKSEEAADGDRERVMGDEKETNDHVTAAFKDEDVVKGRRAKCAACCRSFAAFLFSTIGLTCVLVGYVVLGGFVFVQLEADNEHQTAGDMEEIKRDHILQLWALTERVNVLHPDNWTFDADQILQNYTAIVHVFVKKKGWDGNFNEENEPQWSFAGALLYSITVITTIGM